MMTLTKTKDRVFDEGIKGPKSALELRRLGLALRSFCAWRAGGWTREVRHEDVGQKQYIDRNLSYPRLNKGSTFQHLYNCLFLI